MGWHIATQLLSQVPEGVVGVKQVHGAAIVRAQDIKKGETQADGIFAPANFRWPSMIRTADCLPLIVTTQDSVCALHVSRKTLIRELLDEVPAVIAPAEIISVYLGPHICAKHFVFETMGPEIAAFQERFPGACWQREDGLHISLLAAVEHYLAAWGVPVESRQIDERCTFETPSLPSYRRALRDRQTLVDHIAIVVSRTGN